MRHFTLLCFFLSIHFVSFSQFGDTAALKAYIRDTIANRRPDKITAAQIQKSFIGTIDVLRANLDSSVNAIWATKVAKATGDVIVYYKIPSNPFTGNIEPIVKNGAAASATITSNGIYDNVDVAGGDHTSYIQLNGTQNNDALRVAELRVKVTQLYTTPLIGIRQVYVGNGAHNNTSPNRAVWVNLLTNAASITTNVSTNTSSAIAAVGDIVRLKYYFDPKISNSVLWVYNETTNKYLCYKGNPAGLSGAGFGTAFPAIILAGGAYIILDFRITSGNPSGSKIAVTGDSMGSGYNIFYASSLTAFLDAKLPYNVDNHSGPGQMMEGMARCLRELIETKPKVVVIFNYLAPYYDYFNPANANYTVYISQFRGQLKAIKAYGGVPIIVKIKTWPLITNTQAALWNSFCDSEAALEGGVFTLDLSSLNLTWDSSGYHFDGATNNSLADLIIAFMKANNLY